MDKQEIEKQIKTAYRLDMPETAYAWTVYDSVAEWCAKHGYDGKPGDLLPYLLSSDICVLINADPEAFQRRVRETAYALAMNKLNLPEEGNIMPHDCKGRVVEVGQEVIVRFEVKAVQQCENDCNVDLESVLGMPPSFAKTRLCQINTKQIEVTKEAKWREKTGVSDGPLSDEAL